jgi:hypothetical protein
VSESSEEHSPDRSAIVAVIESPEWDEEDDEELDKEIRQVIGDVEEQDKEDEAEESDGLDDDGGLGIVRVLPNTNEGEMSTRTSVTDSLPQVTFFLHDIRYYCHINLYYELFCIYRCLIIQTLKQIISMIYTAY